MEETKLIELSEIAPEEVSWLWKPYIPAGKLTIIRGNPGEGKTMFVMMLIARLTTGKPLPNEPDDALREPVNCIYQTAEDGLADTIVPRLIANEADMKRVSVIDETSTPLSFSDARIEAAIREKQAKLFVLDPLQAYLGAGVDMYRANEVRPQFHALKCIAERTGCAIVLIEHMNKMKGQKAISRGLGSMDITGSARSVLLLTKPKANDPEVYLAPVKGNLASLGQTLVFSVEDNRMYLEGVSEKSADELVDASSAEYTKSKLARAEELLAKLFSSGRGIEPERVYMFMRYQEISKRTVDAAKKNLGIRSEKDGKNWLWKPAEAK